MVTRRYDLLTLFPARAEERRIVADQHKDRNAIAELCQDLLDQARVALVKAGVKGGKRLVRRSEVPCRVELALRIWIRELHEFLRSKTRNIIQHHFSWKTLPSRSVLSQSALVRQDITRGIIVWFPLKKASGNQRKLLCSHSMPLHRSGKRRR